MIALLLLAACSFTAGPGDGIGIVAHEGGHDDDGDGWCVVFDHGDTATGGPTVGLDCDDSDPNVNPAATEVAGNGKDDDCDGQIDEAP